MCAHPQDYILEEASFSWLTPGQAPEQRNLPVSTYSPPGGVPALPPPWEPQVGVGTEVHFHEVPAMSPGIKEPHF